MLVQKYDALHSKQKVGRSWSRLVKSVLRISQIGQVTNNRDNWKLVTWAIMTNIATWLSLTNFD